MVWHKVPYTNFHDINMDWLISKMRELGYDVKDIEKTVKDFLDSVDIKEDVSNKLDEMFEDGTLESLIADNLSQPSKCGLYIEHVATKGAVNGSCYIEKDNRLVVYYAHASTNIGTLECINLDDFSLAWSVDLDGGHGNSITYNDVDNNIYICKCYDVANPSALVSGIVKVNYDNQRITNINMPDDAGCYSLTYYNGKFYAITSRGREEGVANVVSVYDEGLSSKIDEITLEQFPAIVGKASTQGVQFVNENGLYLVSYNAPSQIFLYDFDGKIKNYYSIPNIVNGYKLVRELQSCFIKGGNLFIVATSKSYSNKYLSLIVLEYEIIKPVNIVNLALPSDANINAGVTINNNYNGYKPAVLNLQNGEFSLYDIADINTVSALYPYRNIKWSVIQNSELTYESPVILSGVNGCIFFNSNTINGGLVIANSKVDIERVNVNGSFAYDGIKSNVLLLNAMVTMVNTNVNSDVSSEYPINLYRNATLNAVSNLNVTSGTSGFDAYVNVGCEIKSRQNKRLKEYVTFNGRGSYRILNSTNMTVDTEYDLLPVANYSAFDYIVVGVSNQRALARSIASAFHVVIPVTNKLRYIYFTIANDKIKISSALEIDLVNMTSTSISQVDNVVIDLI